MHILLVAATLPELNPCLQFLDKVSESKTLSHYILSHHKISVLISGVGSPAMAFSLGQYNLNEVDLVIHAGLSGAFNLNLELGTIVEIEKEKWSDLGARDRDGSFIDIHDLGLSDVNQFPFQNKWLINHFDLNLKIPKMSGITTNCVSGSELEIKSLSEKYPNAIESMEGAAVFYACRMKDVKFVSIRSISNHVQPRDKSLWKIQESIQSLNQYIISLLQELTSGQRKIRSSN
ncbi:MAG: futalosine hydrolase [Saprospiraceae bacterium]|nr:futalosine hydrolase [Saprospiraceae bacterium]